LTRFVVIVCFSVFDYFQSDRVGRPIVEGEGSDLDIRGMCTADGDDQLQVRQATGEFQIQRGERQPAARM
jgi:hypothetical protein